jgi:aconitate hydratase
VAWDGKDFIDLPILVKTKGKTTTDHISPAGPWLRFRGHLDKISDNMFLGALNAFTGETGKGINPLTGASGQPIAKIARDLKAKGVQWIAVGDENYGEGSSREHAAIGPRYLGVRAVIAKSFARIHWQNLINFGILPLTFVDPDDWAKIAPGDVLRLPDAREAIRHGTQLQVINQTKHEKIAVPIGSGEPFSWFCPVIWTPSCSRRSRHNHSEHLFLARNTGVAAAK